MWCFGRENKNENKNENKDSDDSDPDDDDSDEKDVYYCTICEIDFTCLYTHINSPEHIKQDLRNKIPGNSSGTSVKYLLVTGQ